MSARSFRRRGPLTAALAVTLGLGLSVLNAAAASASVGTLTVVEATRANIGGDTHEEATATCQTGTVIGAGWAALSSDGVVIDEVVPDVATGTVRVEAWQGDQGAPNPWSVRARAICATGIFNVELVDDGPSAFNSTSSKSDTATCPFGKKVVGVGFEIGGASGQVHVADVDPSEDRVEVTAYEDDNFTAANWAITALAVCATEPFGLEFVTSPSPAPGTDTTTCPAGKSAIGAGASVDIARNDVSLTDVKVASYAGSQLAVALGREDVDGTGTNWRTAANPICAYS